jgi:hypothetical protein
MGAETTPDNFARGLAFHSNREFQMTVSQRGVGPYQRQQPRPVTDSLESCRRVELLSDGRACTRVESDNGSFERRLLRGGPACPWGFQRDHCEKDQPLADDVYLIIITVHVKPAAVLSQP